MSRFFSRALNKLTLLTSESLARSSYWLMDHQILPSHQNYKRFLVVGAARTGTNLMTQTLNSHAEVSCFREIFHCDPETVEFGQQGYYHKQSTAQIVDLKHNDPVRLVEQEVFRLFGKQIKAVGYKLLYNHACEGSMSAIRSAIKKDDSLLIIHIKRQNVLEKILSAKLAINQKKWYVNDNDCSEYTPSPIKLTQDFCLERFEYNEQKIIEHDELFSNHQVLEVDYETLSNEFAATMNQVQSFLGISRKPLTQRTKKMTTQSPKELISNYEELKSTFETSKWSSYFTE